MIEGMMAGVVGSLWGLLVLGLVVAAFGVANTLGMNVLEQTRELGLLRVVAMTPGQVRKTIMAQAAMLGMIGVVPGLLAGVGPGLHHELDHATGDRPSGGLHVTSVAAGKLLPGGHGDRDAGRLDSSRTGRATGTRRRVTIRVGRSSPRPTFGPSMMKPGRLRGRQRRVDRVLLEVVDRSLHVVHQQGTEVAADTMPHQDSLDNQILAMGR